MKNLSFVFILMLMELMTLCACDPPKINPEKSLIEFTYEGGNDTFDVFANFPIHIMDCPEWVNANLHEFHPEVWSVVLSIEVPTNETGREREGVIVLAGDSIFDRKGNIVEASATIKVKQLAKSTHNDKYGFIHTNKVCPTCNGTKIVKCTRCRGQGYYFHWYEGDVIFCNKCGGYGNGEIEEDGSLKIVRGHKGSGLTKCPTCDSIS